MRLRRWSSAALDPELTYRPDWEVPTRYAVDYVVSRGDVDAGRLALTGHSMGGYFAPRAAAYEKRITAVVANSLTPELKPIIMAMLGLDPDEPYGVDLEDKADLSEPMKQVLVRGSRIDVGWPVSRFLKAMSYGTTGSPTAAHTPNT